MNDFVYELNSLSSPGTSILSSSQTSEMAFISDDRGTCGDEKENVVAYIHKNVHVIKTVMQLLTQSERMTFGQESAK